MSERTRAPRKAQFEAVSIEGVKVFETEESRRVRQKIARGGLPMVTEGTVLAFDLAAPNRSAVGVEPLPAGESAVSALCYVAGRGVYGGTTGGRARFFFMSRTLEIAQIGLPCQGTALRALVRADDQTVVGVVHDAGAGSRLFAYDGAGDTISHYSYTAPPLGTPEDLGVLEPGEEIACLIAPGADGMLYALSATGLLLAYDARKRNVRSRVRAAPEAASPVLAWAGTDQLYGVGPEGYLYRYDTAERRIFYLNARIPAQKGRHYVAEAAQLLPARNGVLYGGTRGDGYLFAFDVASQEVRNLGKPLAGGIHFLGHGRGDMLYGVAGDDVQHLFSYNLRKGAFTDLGMVCGWVPAAWTANEFGALAVGEYGELYLGGAERLGHLMVFFPPVEA